MTPYLVQLRETFTYGGPGGRPSALSTLWANGTTGDLFLQGWTYDDLGQDVYAPTAGTITREIQIIYQGDSRYTGVEMSTPQGHQIKLLYLSLDRSLVGTTIAVGDTIGNAQDLQPRYPGITDHIHLQIRDAAGSLVDPLSLIQLPPQCP